MSHLQEEGLQFWGIKVYTPHKLAWNPTITSLKMFSLVQGTFFRFHLSFLGGVRKYASFVEYLLNIFCRPSSACSQVNQASCVGRLTAMDAACSWLV